MKNSSARPLIILIALFLGLRLLSLLTAIEACSYGEEVLRGNIGLEIMAGSPKPVLEYQTDTYMGGSVAVGVLAAAFFSLFGSSLFTLKLIPLLCFFLPALIFMCKYLKSAFGPRAAVFGALAFIFPVPTMVQMSVIAMGFHAESIAFIAGILYFYHRLETKPEAKNFSLAAFGLLSGFGTWFTPSVLVAIAACVLTDLLFNRGRMIRGRNLFIVTLFFVIGYLPWFIYNWSHKFEGMQYVANGFMTKDRFRAGIQAYAVHFKERFLELIFQTLPRAYGFRRRMGESGEILSYVYLALSFFAWAGLSIDFFQKKKFKTIMPVVIYPVLFLTAYAASSFVLGEQEYMEESRYCIPLFFYTAMILGVYAAYGAWRRKIVYAALIILGVAGYSSLVFKSDFGLALGYRGYYSSFFEILEKSKLETPFFPELQKEILSPDQWVKTPPEPMRCYGFSKIGEWATEKHGFAEVKPQVKNLAERDAACFYSGFTMEFSESPLVYFDGLKDLNGESRKIFVARLSRFLLAAPDDPDRGLVEGRLSGFSEEERRVFFRGLGESVIKDFWSPELPGLPALRKFYSVEIPEKYSNDFYWGLGRALGADLNCDRKFLRNWIRQLPREAWQPANKGFSDAEEFYQVAQGCRFERPPGK